MRAVRFTTLLVWGCFLAAPALAADPAKELDGDHLPPGEYAGKLLNPPGTDGSFRLKVEIDQAQVNNGAVNGVKSEVRGAVHDQEHIDHLQAEMARTRDPKHYAKLQQELAAALQHQQAHLVKAEVKEGSEVKIVKSYKDIDFHAADGVKVRTMTPPVQYDDKGNPKKYTKQELDALKGADKDLPGYETSLVALKAGDLIRVTLGAPRADKKAPAKDKDADPEPKTDPATKKVNEVTVIVVLGEDGGKK